MERTKLNQLEEKRLAVYANDVIECWTLISTIRALKETAKDPNNWIRLKDKVKAKIKWIINTELNWRLAEIDHYKKVLIAKGEDEDVVKSKVLHKWWKWSKVEKALKERLPSVEDVEGDGRL